MYTVDAHGGHPFKVIISQLLLKTIPGQYCTVEATGEGSFWHTPMITYNYCSVQQTTVTSL